MASTDDRRGTDGAGGGAAGGSAGGSAGGPANRLAGETSPYLLQHAHNPVDWRPWGPEAIEEARARDVPIFLSIGYSTCYWCHVMERESFESERIAALLNPRFVPVKVDREERPDLDELYMAATVLMNGHGGWPMSVFLEPDTLRPFWCGTYFPAEASPAMGGRPTFPQVLDAMSGAYAGQRENVRSQGAEVARAVEEHLAGAQASADLGQEQVADAVSGLLRSLDRVHGGFGGAPKFPQPVFLDFLLDARARADETTREAIDGAVRLTLDRMACGGVRDQVGGGFHRYSVDAHWLVPHFEKMLYDNAQLAAVYARSAAAYGDAEYARIARSTIDYVLWEMLDDGGAFHSAQDAEVDGREGLNYLWTKGEVEAALTGEGDAAFAVEVYGLAEGPNFKDPHHPGEPARNVLRLADRPEKLAAKRGETTEVFLARLGRVNAALLAARNTRRQPRLDDKVLTAWNGLMIAAMAVAARELAEPAYLAAAERAADFVMRTMIGSDGAGGQRLLRSYRAGVAKTPAFLEDHAFLAQALLEIARSLPERARGARVGQARLVMDLAREAFFDEATGAIYDTREGEADLFLRTRSTHDGAVPSGHSATLHALLDLAELTGVDAFRARAVAALATISGQVAGAPLGTVNAVRALLRMLLAGEDHAAALRSVGGTPRPRPGLALAADEALGAVEIYASVDRVAVGSDAPASLTIVVKIAEGYHVAAANPGDVAQGVMSLIPFRVGIAHGTGVAAYAAYPDGEAFGGPPAGPILVYRGTFELTVALEAAGAWTGRPLLTVTYQPCTDDACLAAATVELDIAIDRA